MCDCTLLQTLRVYRGEGLLLTFTVVEAHDHCCHANEDCSSYGQTYHHGYHPGGIFCVILKQPPSAKCKL